VILGSVVDWHDLLEVIWVSAAAATILVIATSLAILGGARANSARRDGHHGTAVLFGTLGIAGAAVCAGGIVLAVSVMLAK
jgi:hypothetical protein